MRPAIEFINNAGKAPDPIAKTREALTFRELVLKEDYKDRKTKFGQGLTWLRFLPAIKPSLYDWMMPIQVHADINGVTFTSPKTLDSNAQSCFETARIWLQRHNKSVLASKDKNPNGFRLYDKRYGISWAVEEAAPEGERLKIFYASLYDGSRGGTTGLGYNVRREADARDNEPGSPSVGELIHGDITAPQAGRLVKVEKTPSDKSEYASYKAGIGKNPAPLDHHLSLLTDQEMQLLTPLENLIYIPSEEEQQDILRRYIGEKLFYEIFGPVAPRTSGWEPDAERREPEPAPKAVQADLEPVPAPTKTPEPKAPEPKAAVEPKAADATAPYTTREVTALLSKEKEGITELLKNRDRLTKVHLEIVLDSAKEYGIEA